MNTALPTLIRQLQPGQLQPWRAGGMALVPTLGHLHRGHLQLVQQARRLARHVVVSIFVNPLQFGEHEDYADYPRTLEADVQALQGLADMVYAPPVEAVYPATLQGHTRVSVPELGELLCGQFRPGHFVGVTTAVAILFNLLQPDVAVFGSKDLQQLRLIQRMCSDLHIPVQIVAVPTVREADGLAVSSRNAYLDAEQRQAAPALYRALVCLAEALRAQRASVGELESRAMGELQQAGLRPEYVSVRDENTLAPPGDTGRVVLASAWLGRARLIDNVPVD